MRTLALLLALVPLPVFGQAKFVGLKVETTGLDVITQPLHVKLLIANSSESLINIHSTRLILPDEVALYPRTAEVNFPNGTLDLDAHGFRDLELTVPAMALTPLKDSWRVLFFRAKTYRFTVQAEYVVQGSPTKHMATQEFTLMPLAPWWTVLLGGLVGVPVVLVFLYLYDRVRGTPAGSRPARQVSNVLLGWMAILLATIVFRFTSTNIPDLPLAVNVNDILGGFLIGLLYNYFADFFFKSLTPGAKESNH